MARVGDLERYCERHGLKMITVADLIAYRRKHDRLVERVVDTRLPTGFGEFTAVGYRSLVDGKHHVALVKGDVAGESDVLVRVHSECLTGDVFHSLRCDCGEQLEQALARIEQEGRGVLLYMAQEGRGIGLLNKLRAYELQEQGLDTVEANIELGFPADARDYGIGNQILADLGLTTLRITSRPSGISSATDCTTKTSRISTTNRRPTREQHRRKPRGSREPGARDATATAGPCARADPRAGTGSDPGACGRRSVRGLARGRVCGSDRGDPGRRQRRACSR
jgi:3,4-dihydroxy 2-butanone 4-phosphate synthase/GTP cyclohydrolase II